MQFVKSNVQYSSRQQVPPPVAAAPTETLTCPQCGDGELLIRKSTTEKNPGRDFYTCSAKCKFFAWVDDGIPKKRKGKFASAAPAKTARTDEDNARLDALEQHGHQTDSTLAIHANAIKEIEAFLTQRFGGGGNSDQE